MIHRWTILLIALVICDCGRRRPSGPATTQTSSTAFATVSERTAFLKKYVTFRRTYDTLDFDIAYQNNGGGMVPGPSDWDVRLVATVPAAELSAWIPSGVATTTGNPPAAETEWLKSVPTTLKLIVVTEWYVENRRVVGVDRTRRIVAYRAWAY